jgi:hypothetical protein
VENPSSSQHGALFAGLGRRLAALIVWASMNANFGESFSAITADPWGIVSLVDLYLGFLIFAAFVFLGRWSASGKLRLGDRADVSWQCSGRALAGAALAGFGQSACRVA